MNRLWIYSVISIFMIFACVGKAAIGWEENFDPVKPTWSEVSAYWTDLAGPAAKLTENDPAVSYGVATSEEITIDVSVYSELVITSTEVEAGAYYSVQIQEVGGGHADAVSYIGTAGTQTVNIAALMGWSGTKTFVINIWIEGESKAVTFGLLRLKTPTEVSGWIEDFDPIKTTWAEPSATWTDLAGPIARLTESDPVNSYGDAVSEIITVDVSVYSELVITSTEVESGALYTVQIMEVGSGANANAVSYVGESGTQIVNIAALMGWSGTKSFVIQIWIEGESKSVTFGLLQLREPSPSEGWIEDFNPIKSTWTQTSATWDDISGPTAKLTESDPVNAYGVTSTEVITLDVSQYNELVIEATQFDAGALYSVQIHEIGGAGAYDDAVSYVGDPGTQIVDIAALMGWSGVKSFVIKIWIDGDSKGVTFNSLQLRSSAPPLDGWIENFNPIKTTWIDATCSWTDTPGPNAVLTVTPNPEEWWGYTNSETITIDVDDYSELYIKTTEVETGCRYTVQIQEIGGASASGNAVSLIAMPSEHKIDLRGLMGWSGVKTFQVNIWLDCGDEGYNVTFNKIEIRKGSPILWRDDFDPILTTWNEGFEAYWTDLPGSYAVLTEDNPYDNYGKVESETLFVNLDFYNELSFKVIGVDTGGRLDIGVQGQGDPWPYFDVATYITGPDTVKVNIADITGWTGYKQLRVVLWINGNGKSATLDYIQLAMDCGTDVLAGDFYEDCVVDFKDLAAIGETWMNEYDMFDLKDISDNWLIEQY